MTTVFESLPCVRNPQPTMFAVKKPRKSAYMPRTMGAALFCMERYNSALHQAHAICKQGGMMPFSFNTEELSVIHAIHIAIGTERWNAIIEQIFQGIPPPFHKDPMDGHYRLGLLLPFMTPQQQVLYGRVHPNLQALIWWHLTRDEQHIVQGVSMGACTIAQLFLFPLLSSSSIPPAGLAFGLAPATPNSSMAIGTPCLSDTDDQGSVMYGGRSNGPSPTSSATSARRFIYTKN